MILLDHYYEKCTTFHVFYKRNPHNPCRFCIFVCRFRDNYADHRNSAIVRLAAIVSGDLKLATALHYILFWRTYLTACMSEVREWNRILDDSFYMH